jgi:integrase
LPPGRKEANTLLTERIHRGHILRILGADTPVGTIPLSAAQSYASARSRDAWRGRPIGADTVRKELKALGHVWAWAHALGHVDAACPWALKDLRLGKDVSREPFRTMVEIERRIARGGLGDEEQSRLWECLYLAGAEVESLLDYARDHATAGFVGPMVEFCALTGARRSELCRARVDDFDFENRTVHIRERKRVHSRRETTRVVELHERLARAMRAWFDAHPGGQFALAQDDGAPVSVSLATEHVRRTLAGDPRWHLIPGFHTLRHSFASILAARGVDQRVIDAFMGHQTPEMRASYQHLFPKALRRAIDELLA